MLEYLKKISAELVLILERLQLVRSAIVATAKEFSDLVTAIDNETTRIAIVIDDLVEKLTAGGMTQDEESASLTALGAVADRLRSIGKDPANVVPKPV